jgi:hypothetical protein
MIDESFDTHRFGPRALISFIEKRDATAGDTYIYHISYRVKVVILRPKHDPGMAMLRCQMAMGY